MKIVIIYSKATDGSRLIDIELRQDQDCIRLALPPYRDRGDAVVIADNLAKIIEANCTEPVEVEIPFDAQTAKQEQA